MMNINNNNNDNNNPKEGFGLESKRSTSLDYDRAEEDPLTFAR